MEQAKDGAEQKETGPGRDVIQNVHSESQDEQKDKDNVVDESKNIAGDATNVGGDTTVHDTQTGHTTPQSSSATPGGDAEDVEEISPDFSDNATLPQGSDKTTEVIDSALKDLPPKCVFLLSHVAFSKIV